MEWGEGFQDFITELIWLFEAFLSSAEGHPKTQTYTYTNILMFKWGTYWQSTTSNLGGLKPTKLADEPL